ncbi:hypothetical protein [Mucilaginibacter sp.]
MKILFSVSVLLIVWGFNASAQKIIKARDAKKYIGKEIIVVGKLCDFSNSSYIQAATYNIETDSSHVGLTVILQGQYYQAVTSQDFDNPKSLWIGNYIGKLVKIKGIVKVDDHNDIWVDATDRLMLK